MIDSVQDFDPFCAVVEDVQAGIIQAWANEEHRQAEQAMGLAEVAVERDLEQQAMRACDVGSIPNRPDSRKSY